MKPNTMPNGRKVASSYTLPHTHYSARYKTLQRVDHVAGIKRNLRPLQIGAAV